MIGCVVLAYGWCTAGLRAEHGPLTFLRGRGTTGGHHGTETLTKLRSSLGPWPALPAVSDGDPPSPAAYHNTAARGHATLRHEMRMGKTWKKGFRLEQWDAKGPMACRCQVQVMAWLRKACRQVFIIYQSESEF